jgi:polyhydroxyalkanoate synthesis repressor PhaR
MPASVSNAPAERPESVVKTSPEKNPEKIDPEKINPGMASAPVGGAAASSPPVVVKKYANRRLYNTESSSYITLDNLAEMVRTGRDFVVYDAKTGEDITRSVLTQIIVEEEGKGRAMLPTGFLRQLIGFYGNSMQGLVPNYLEKAMDAFAEQQEKVRVTVQETVGNLFPGIEEVSRQNLALMERAMGMFAPFYRAPDAPAPTQEHPEGNADPEREIAVLRAEVERLRQALTEAQAQISTTTKS